MTKSLSHALPKMILVTNMFADENPKTISATNFKCQNFHKTNTTIKKGSAHRYSNIDPQFKKQNK